MLLLWPNPLVPFLLSIAKSVRRSNGFSTSRKIWRNSRVDWSYTGPVIALRFTCPAVSVPQAPGTHLSPTYCPISQREKDDMATRSYREPVELWLGLRWAIGSTSRLGRFGCFIQSQFAMGPTGGRKARPSGTSGGDSSSVATIWRFSSYADADWGE